MQPLPWVYDSKEITILLKVGRKWMKNIANQFYGKSKETNISKLYSILYYSKIPFNKIELVGKLKSNFFLPLTNKYVQCCPLKSLWMVVFNIYLELGCASAFSQKFFDCDDDSYHNMCFSIVFSTLINLNWYICIVESRKF